jgi:RNA polymerase sigma factor (sigma-70 family)
LQNTFLAAYRDLPRFEQRSSLRTWLYGIAAHRCHDLLKKRRRVESRFVAMDPLPDASAPGATTEEVVATREAARVIETCLARLGAQARLAVLLRYHEGLSYPEMAVVCEAEPATLQARVARALPALRRCVESFGVSL